MYPIRSHNLSNQDLPERLYLDECDWVENGLKVSISDFEQPVRCDPFLFLSLYPPLPLIARRV